MNTELLPISKVFPNIGQVKGLNKNPRFIRDEKYKKLLQSIKDDPEMLELRELIVYDTDNPDTGYVVIGGNMRYRAMKELGYKEVPCKVLHPGFPVEKMRRIVLKDNSGFGEWDFESLVNEWAIEEIDLAAIDIPDLGEALEDDHTPTQEPTPQEESTVKEDDDFEENDITEDDVIKEGDLWKLGRHTLLCGDCTKQENIARLFPSGDQIDLWLSDPPYNVAYGFEGSVSDIRKTKKDGLYVLNDKQDNESFLQFLIDAFGVAKSFMKPGASYYLFHSDTFSFYFRLALMTIEGMDLRENLIWNKNSLVLGRQDYHWKHEPCQPAGTMVLTVNGEKPIESLTEEDRVIAYNSLRGQVLGYKNGGYAIKTANRDYDGLLYTISVDGRQTRATDNHQFSVRFNPKARKNYCTYLMRKGNWWRVGHTVAYDARQFGIKTRAHQEEADEAWLIDVYEDRVTAQAAEQVLAVKYGIPYTHWNIQRGFTKSIAQRTELHIGWIYENLDLKAIEDGANRMLSDFGRSRRFPLYTKERKHEKFSTRVTARIEACNLIPEIMQLPIPRDPAAHKNFEWVSITNVTSTHFEGKVYSLAVEEHEHYISDGIVTHNCLYGWKEGGSHNWYSDRKQSTVIDWDRPTKSIEHPCLSPETLVMTIGGYKPIGDIQKGEKVLSADGKFHVVEFVSRHPYNEPIYKITAYGSNIFDRATHNHPYLIARRKKDRTFDVGFMEADKLKVGDYLMTPQIEQGTESPVTELDAWCYGLWLAQGSLQKAGHGDNEYPVFSLDARKEELQTKILEWSGDKNASKYPNGGGNGIKIVVFDDEKAKRCVELCGKYAEGKVVSSEVFEWSKPLRRSFFEGYMAGDGCVIATRGHRHSKSVSIALASQIRFLAESLGYRTSFYQREPKDGAGIGERKFKTLRTFYATDYRKSDGNAILRPFEYEGVKYLLRRVTDISTHPYNDDVVNLSVEGNHTFQTVCGSTHNTMKPVGLVGYLMKNSSKKDDIVFDGFGGSGTTLIAAEQLGRKCRMSELSPHYAKVIIWRYIKLRKNYADVFRINEDGSQTSIMELFDKEELDALCAE